MEVKKFNYDAFYQCKNNHFKFSPIHVIGSILVQRLLIFDFTVENGHLKMHFSVIFVINLNTAVCLKMKLMLYSVNLFSKVQ